METGQEKKKGIKIFPTKHNTIKTLQSRMKTIPIYLVTILKRLVRK